MTEVAGVYLDARMTEPEVSGFVSGTIAVYSARRPGGEGENEDAVLRADLGEDRGILAVADGAGGAAAGARASATALLAIRSRVQGADPELLRESILLGVDDANAGVAALGVGAATTLALVVVRGRTVRSYHVGDSIVLATGQRGKRKLETVAHSPVGYAVEAGVIDEREAMHHGERHIVSNLVGCPDMRVEISPPVELAARDTLLLASDGVTDNLHVDEIVDLIRKGPIEGAANELAREVLSRMDGEGEKLPSKPDDLSFVLFRPR
ncbi:MAG: PP2C family protein-serine/threonine phosphatase [Planctomycetota bacterium]|jgi:serine/threonine protein phosphatase PrpC